jgi:glucosamine--fructose-6-phosphate aminotransferase (isomerizing)
MLGVEDNLEENFWMQERIVCVRYLAGISGRICILKNCAIQLSGYIRSLDEQYQPKDIYYHISRRNCRHYGRDKTAKEKVPLFFGLQRCWSSISQRQTQTLPVRNWVASTAFTTQITVLTMIACAWQNKRNALTNTEFHRYLQELEIILKSKEALE